MPIKWSALKVSEAMDEVEAQVLLADQFIADAKAKVEVAKKIPKAADIITIRIERMITAAGESPAL